METIKLKENQIIKGEKHNALPIKLWVVTASDNVDCADGSWTVAIFGTEEEAKKYCEIHELIDDCYKYWYTEQQLDHIDLNTEVKPYYYFSFDTDFSSQKELVESGLIDTSITTPGYIDSMCYKLNHPDNNWCNNDETINRIYDEDLHIEINDYGSYKHYTVYSINSYEEARSTGLKIWEEQYENFKN